MKTLAVRLPNELAKEIEAESRAAGCSKSDVVRQRLEARARRGASQPPSFFDLAEDLIGSVGGNGLPADLSARKKHLRERGYGKEMERSYVAKQASSNRRATCWATAVCSSCFHIVATLILSKSGTSPIHRLP